MPSSVNDAFALPVASCVVVFLAITLIIATRKMTTRKSLAAHGALAHGQTMRRASPEISADRVRLAETESSAPEQPMDVENNIVQQLPARRIRPPRTLGRTPVHCMTPAQHTAFMQACREVIAEGPPPAANSV